MNLNLCSEFYEMCSVESLFYLRPQGTKYFDCASAPTAHGLGTYSPNKAGTSASSICFNMLAILQRFKGALFDIEVTLSIQHRQ